MDPEEQLLSLMRASPATSEQFAPDVEGVIAELRDAASRGYLTHPELLRVITVKVQHRADGAIERARTAPETYVEDITRLAFGMDRHNWESSDALERARIGLLSSLPGVEVPTASAILAWTHPERFGVIDRRAWNTLYKFGLVPRRGDKETTFRPAQWIRYLPIIVEFARRLSSTPQLVDTWLYHYDKAAARRSH